MMARGNDTDVGCRTAAIVQVFDRACPIKLCYWSWDIVSHGTKANRLVERGAGLGGKTSVKATRR